MEIEVGEYMRTKDGYIAQIIEIDRYIWFDNKINKESGMPVYELSKVEFENLVTKHSKNIIDLIEVNDIIVTKHPEFENIYYEHIWSDEYLKHIKDYLNEKSLILLQILTHEQFEQNAYRLEESNG